MGTVGAGIRSAARPPESDQRACQMMLQVLVSPGPRFEADEERDRAAVAADRGVGAGVVGLPARAADADPHSRAGDQVGREDVRAWALKATAVPDMPGRRGLRGGNRPATRQDNQAVGTSDVRPVSAGLQWMFAASAWSAAGQPPPARPDQAGRWAAGRGRPTTMVSVISHGDHLACAGKDLRLT